MIKRALISVHNKNNIVRFAQELSDRGIKIISTGGTYDLLSENKIKATRVEEITGFPEVLGGRVKTIHPAIAAAILADRNNPEHVKELNDHFIIPIDLVVVSLYPFKETISNKNISHKEAIEQIDIGGVTLIRAAAKNYSNIAVITNEDQYSELIKKIDANNITQEYLLELAGKAFNLVKEYDNDISGYFSSLTKSSQALRYGENPHQKAELIKTDFDEIFKVLHGKELSYNNILDIDAAYDLISEFENDEPACVIIKHGNPSGVSSSKNVKESYLRALSGDPVSAFGGIIIFNAKIDFNTCLEVDKLFSEIILAPDYTDDALELLKKKKNRRIIKFSFIKNGNNFNERKITGGYLRQEKNMHIQDPKDLKLVTGSAADAKQMSDILFALKVIKHVKSNAVIFVKDKMTLGIGAGQPSRVDSIRIATVKAKEFGHSLKGSIAASDAFFPFPDGLIQIADAGAEIILQPGGSVKDDEVIEEAKNRNLIMYLSGVRHFKH
ncbi:bifunctional phosphoribosylaminoimidazolecarboxamide formyltransferase/IMP cyclohydrolase [soil metagenome]